MNEFLVITLIVIVGILFSKILLYIYNRICYIFLELCIRFGNDWVQNKINKLLL